MTAIKATWNGNGLPDDTELEASNVNTPGNSFGGGVNWALVGTGSADGFWEAFTAGDGFRYNTDATGMVMLRSIFPEPPPAVRAQVIVTIPAPDVIDNTYAGIIQAYNTTAANQGWVRLLAGQYFDVYRSSTDIASRSPAMATGTRALVDVVYHAGTSASRIFYRVTNLSDPNWNGTGYFFYDTGYTLPAGNAYGMLQFGKSTTGAAVVGDGILLERIGAEAITVSESAVSEAAASAYFADKPGDPLPIPVLTITASTDPTSPGASDGTITASWAPISGASRHEAGIAAGDVDDGFEVVETNATSPYTWTGLRAGVHTVAVRAIP